MSKKVDISELTNELIYRRYMMNNGQSWQRFKELNMTEYIALHTIAKAASEENIYSGRTYLKDLADKMQISIHRTSKIVGNLRDRGLINWAHDGDGSDGTYVVITDSGNDLLNNQAMTLKDYYGRVIEKYGRDNMIKLLQMMKQLETVMSSESEETEVITDDSTADETVF